MDIIRRNNVRIRGNGTVAMMFAHGFGCDQNMWRFVAPAFEKDFRTVLFDHVGSGASDLSAYSSAKYATLEGYASDIVEIGRTLALRNAVFVGHSVSAMMGIMAAIEAPEIFSRLVLVGPSPSYIDDGDYVGGFTREQIDELLKSLDENHLGWSMAMAPMIMGNPERPELAEELANSFCRTDPKITREFARTTFLTDARHVLETDVPALILQCSNDVVAPLDVGNYMHAKMRQSTLVIMKATGHCPNLSAPQETIDAMRAYLCG